MTSRRSCKIDGCTRVGVYHSTVKKHHLVKGFCNSHYRRYRKYGTPEGGRTPDGEPLEFMEQLKENKVRECITWPYAKTSQGYAQIRVKGVTKSVCRMLLQEQTLQKGVGLDCRHICGNGHLGCVNTSHLEWGTRKQNVEDMEIHGTKLLGEKTGAAKLTEGQVRYIITSTKNQNELAKMFGVGQQAISKIKLRLRWGHLSAVD